MWMGGGKHNVISEWGEQRQAASYQQGKGCRAGLQGWYQIVVSPPLNRALGVSPLPGLYYTTSLAWRQLLRMEQLLGLDQSLLASVPMCPGSLLPNRGGRRVALDRCLPGPGSLPLPLV